MHAFAPLPVGDADYGARRDRGMSRYDVLHLSRVDVLAAADDHVFHAVNDVHVTIIVHISGVTSVHPPIAQRHGRIVWPFPVPEHHIGSAADDLASRSPRHFVVADAHDAYLGMNGRPAG